MDRAFRSHGVLSLLAFAVTLNIVPIRTAPAVLPLPPPFGIDLAASAERVTGPWSDVRKPYLRTAVETLLLEAAGEGLDGMTAVGEVIRNRAKLFHMGVRDVCLKPYQFSGWNDRAAARAFLQEHRKHYAPALEAWRRSASSNLARGATDYHADYVRPWWIKYYAESARVGQHIFYRRIHPSAD